MGDNPEVEDKIEKQYKGELHNGNMSFNQQFNLYKSKQNNQSSQEYKEVSDDRQIVVNLVHTFYKRYSNDGVMTESSLEKIMKEVGLTEFCSPTGIKQIWSEIDTNKDSHVSREELSEQFYNNFIQRQPLDK